MTEGLELGVGDMDTWITDMGTDWTWLLVVKEDTAREEDRSDELEVTAGISVTGMAVEF
jgi:hypothetical protein